MSFKAQCAIDIESLNDNQIIDMVMQITKTKDIPEMLQVIEGWADLEVHVMTLKNELENAISILKGVEESHSA